MAYQPFDLWEESKREDEREKFFLKYPSLKKLFLNENISIPEIEEMFYLDASAEDPLLLKEAIKNFDQLSNSELTFGQLYSLTGNKIKKRAKNQCHVLDVKFQESRTPTGKYVQEWQSHVQATDGPRDCHIKLISDNANEPLFWRKAWVTCSCPYWQFYREYAVTDKKASSIEHGNGQAYGTGKIRPDINRNPDMKFGLCKHLVAVYDYLKQKQLTESYQDKWNKIMLEATGHPTSTGHDSTSYKDSSAGNIKYDGYAASCDVSSKSCGKIVKEEKETTTLYRERGESDENFANRAALYAKKNGFLSIEFPESGAIRCPTCAPFSGEPGRVAIFSTVGECDNCDTYNLKEEEVLDEDELKEIVKWKEMGIEKEDPFEVIEKYVTSLDNGLTSVPYHLHFSSVPKIGINPGYSFDTPLGIYTYPLSDYIFKKKFIDKESEYREDLPYLFLLKQKEGTNILNNSLTEEQCYQYYKKLKELYTGPLMSDVINVIRSRSDNDAKVRSPLGRFWYVTWELAQDLSRTSGMQGKEYKYKFKRDREYDTGIVTKGSRQYSYVWSEIFRKLGIDGVSDVGGEGIIHSNEPSQAVFFGADKLKIVKMFENPLTKEKETSSFQKARWQETLNAIGNWGYNIKKKTIEMTGTKDVYMVPLPEYDEMNYEGEGIICFHYYVKVQGKYPSSADVRILKGALSPYKLNMGEGEVEELENEVFLKYVDYEGSFRVTDELIMASKEKESDWEKKTIAFLGSEINFANEEIEHKLTVLKAVLGNLNNE